MTERFQRIHEHQGGEHAKNENLKGLTNVICAFHDLNNLNDLDKLNNVNKSNDLNNLKFKPRGRAGAGPSRRCPEKLQNVKKH